MYAISFNKIIKLAVSVLAFQQIFHFVYFISICLTHFIGILIAFTYF